MKLTGDTYLELTGTHEKKEIRTWNSVEVAGAAQWNRKQEASHGRRRMAEPRCSRREKKENRGEVTGEELEQRS